MNLEALIPDIRRPIYECVAVDIHPNVKGNSKQERFIPSGIEFDASLTTTTETGFYSTRRDLNESVTNPSSKTFFKSRFAEFAKVYNELNFNDDSIVISAMEILNICAKNKNYSVSISKTDDDEILFYTKHNNQYRNLLIDNDGDIHYMLIGNKLGEEKSAVFSREDGLDYHKIASLI